jgi:light-regulated signal transduction histidine kinase (bacteriophytochrome)
MEKAKLKVNVMVDHEVTKNKSERREEMQNLLLRISELEREKKELRDLNEIMIHNLSSPIGAIAECSDELKSQLKKEDGDIRESVMRIANMARYSKSMLQELIGFVRASSAELRLQPIDLSAIAMNIAAGHRELDPERTVELIIQPGMRVYGDNMLIRIMMMELIGNAWKYTAKKNHAKIEISGHQTNDEMIIYVRDNGTGFDPIWAGLLFGPFKRFCEDPDFGGAGIGLATVARIVERHGGRVWAVGYPDEGATIYVALKINDNNSRL